MPPKPQRLRADNITPPQRTPWGGRWIVDVCKAESWPEGRPRPSVVGESWEISVDSVFPSRTQEGRLLEEIISSSPREWLGGEVAERFGQTPLLVKILDAKEWLSIQVHPAEDDASLGPEESHKPEAWIILEAATGAELLLGFKEGVDAAAVRAKLDAKEPLDQLMNRVSVQAGEVFVIEAGTPHAIGPGVTLLEPQWNEPGKHGVTCRFWDWDRLYDSEGRPSESGSPRQLHVDRSIAVTRWQGDGGDAWVDACRRQPRPLPGGPGVQGLKLVDESWMYVESWSGTGAAELHRNGGMVALTCVRGAGSLVVDGHQLSFMSGESVVVPAAVSEGTLMLEDALVFVSSAICAQGG